MSYHRVSYTTLVYTTTLIVWERHLGLTRRGCCVGKRYLCLMPHIVSYTLLLLCGEEALVSYTPRLLCVGKALMSYTPRLLCVGKALMSYTPRFLWALVSYTPRLLCGKGTCVLHAAAVVWERHLRRVPHIVSYTLPLCLTCRCYCVGKALVSYTLWLLCGKLQERQDDYSLL